MHYSCMIELFNALSPKMTSNTSFRLMYNRTWHWRPNTLNSHSSFTNPVFNLLNFIMSFPRGSSSTSVMSCWIFEVGTNTRAWESQASSIVTCAKWDNKGASWIVFPFSSSRPMATTRGDLHQPITYTDLCDHMIYNRTWSLSGSLKLAQALEHGDLKLH